MHSGKTVFKQLLQFLPRYEFNLGVSRYRGEHWVKKFSTYDQFLCLAYAQMAGRESLRDIETCLNSHQEKLYHLGFRGHAGVVDLQDPGDASRQACLLGTLVIGQDLDFLAAG